MTVRVRFAPSPTGYLHVGNVRTALYNWLFARQKNGAFILRIEDTDVERSEKQYEEQLMEDLRWLGMSWEESVDVGGAGPYRQSDRLHLYQQYADRLWKEGKAYYCFCSPEELESERQKQLAAGEQPRYSGKCRRLAPEESARRVQAGEKAALRLKVREGTVGFDDIVFGPIQVDCSTIGDFILLRSDQTAQYNFACVVDDASMRITHIIRGEGHISNTHRQILLYEALDLGIPHFAHLSTILGRDGAKLSKRHGATSIDEFRRQGYLPEALVNYLALLGWAPREEGREILKPQELIQEFDLTRVNRSPAIFDLDKLNWVNRSHLKNVERSRLIRLALPYFQARGLLPADPSEEVQAWFGQVTEAVLNYLDKLEDVAREAQIVLGFDAEKELSEPGAQEVLSHNGARQVIRVFAEKIRRYDFVDFEAYKQAVNETKAETGQKGKNLFHPIRVALTARSSGPELEKLIPIFEQGSQLDLPVKVLGVKERVAIVASQLTA